MKNKTFSINNENIQNYKLMNTGFLLLENKDILCINFLAGYFDSIQEAYDCQVSAYFSKIDNEVVLVVKRVVNNSEIEDIKIFWKEWWNYNLTIFDKSSELFTSKKMSIADFFEKEDFHSEENFIPYVPYAKKFEDIFPKINNNKYLLTDIISSDETNIIPVLNENILDEIL